MMFEYMVKHPKKAEAHILFLQKQANNLFLTNYSFEDVCNAVQEYCKSKDVETIDVSLQDIVKHLKGGE